MLEYTKCLADSLTIFNRRVVEHTKVCEVHEDIAQKQRANKRNSRTSLEVRDPVQNGDQLYITNISCILRILAAYYDYKLRITNFCCI